jgi:glycosyltransferase involved in cell wall biosynthesis
MKISFIVLTYNRSDALLAVLQSLSRQCTSDHEVLIADDGSGHAAVELLFKNCPVFRCPVSHVWHSDKGFTAARARNLGASFATGDYLVFLDGDCVPNRVFAREHRRLAERGYFVNGSRVLLSERLTAKALSGDIDLPAQPSTFWLGARWSGDANKLLHVLPWPWPLFRVQKEFRWHGIRSCNLGIWRKNFIDVNGFDETFEGWGHEDADLVLRLSHLALRRKNGFLATEVYHLWHRENARDYESINKQKIIQRMKTIIVLAEKGLREIGHDASVKVTSLY